MRPRGRGCEARGSGSRTDQIKGCCVWGACCGNSRGNNLQTFGAVYGHQETRSAIVFRPTAAAAAAPRASPLGALTGRSRTADPGTRAHTATGAHAMPLGTASIAGAPPCGRAGLEPGGGGEGGPWAARQVCESARRREPGACSAAMQRGQAGMRLARGPAALEQRAAASLRGIPLWHGQGGRGGRDAGTSCCEPRARPPAAPAPQRARVLCCLSVERPCAPRQRCSGYAEPTPQAGMAPWLAGGPGQRVRHDVCMGG